MPLEVGQAAVKWLVSNYYKRDKKDRENIHINFFGGEPMLRYEQLMVPLMEWADRNIALPDGHQIKWGMTTNGTLLTKERLRYLAQRKDFDILFSCDGDKYTQNINRRTKDDKDSFQLVQPHIKDLLYYFPYVTFRSTTTPETVDHLFDNYFFAKQQGFKNFFFMPNCREPWSEEKILELGYQMSNIGWVMYQDISKGIQICSYNDLIRFMLDFVITQQDIDISCKQCGFGCQSVGIATNGVITGCQERNTFSENDFFEIGDIYNGINIEKYTHLADSVKGVKKRYNTSLDCTNCPIRKRCSTRICPSINYDMTGSPACSNDIMCYWHILLYGTAKNLCDVAALENNQAFLNFLTKQTKQTIPM